MPGIGRRTAEVVIAEIGVDMSRFPTSGHLASWAGLCPGHHESAGKQRSGKARKGNAALRSALCEAAWSAAAFEVFTIGIGSWWDADKHILRAPPARMEFQPWVGGRTIDHVLTHRHLDRHGDGWEGIRDAVSSGWSLDGLPTTLAADQPLPRISDDQIRARLGGSAANTMVVLLPTDTLVRPQVDPIIWAHGGSSPTRSTRSACSPARHFPERQRHSGPKDP